MADFKHNLQAFLALQHIKAPQDLTQIAAIISEIEYFVGQTDRLFYQGSAIQQAARPLWDSFTSLEALHQGPGMMAKVIANRKAVKPYKPSGKGGMKIEFR